MNYVEAKQEAANRESWQDSQQYEEYLLKQEQQQWEEINDTSKTG